MRIDPAFVNNIKDILLEIVDHSQADLKGRIASKLSQQPSPLENILSEIKGSITYLIINLFSVELRRLSVG